MILDRMMPAIGAMATVTDPVGPGDEPNKRDLDHDQPTSPLILSVLEQLLVPLGTSDQPQPSRLDPFTLPRNFHGDPFGAKDQ